jgi:hypothetical protein
MTYRVGNHQPQNVYRGDQYIGVMFTAEDAALAVEALNGTGPGDRCPSCDHPRRMHHSGDCWFTVNIGRIDTNLVCPCMLPGQAADSCTCAPRPGVPGGMDLTCPVHQGRRGRGPKPPPVGEGCICDGSGRTCPRHGAVI